MSKLCWLRQGPNRYCHTFTFDSELSLVTERALGCHDSLEQKASQLYDSLIQSHLRAVLKLGYEAACLMEATASQACAKV